MSAHWWWSWGIGLPSTSYSTTQWAVSSTSAVFTSNTTNLNSPTGSTTPAETKNLRVDGFATLTTPVFPGGSINTGWVVLRWNPNLGGLATIGFLVFVLKIRTNSTDTVVIKSTATATLAPLGVYVNGTLVGTSTDVFGQGSEVLAVDFDLTQTPPQAGLVVSGRRQVPRAGGSGVPVVVNNLQLSSGESSGTAYLGDVVVFESLSDLTDATSQNVWVACMHPDGSTDADNSWTPTSGTDASVTSDGNPATYTESIDRPDTIDFSFQNRADVVAGWAPSTVRGVATVTYSSTTWSPTTSLTLLDNGVSVGAAGTGTVNSDGTFLGKWAALDSTSSPWTGPKIDTLGATFTVNI